MSDELELYKKYRPSEFSQVVGQTDAIKSLIDLGKRKQIPHSILFTGGSGCGKTTLARILKDKLKCSDHDFAEINAAEQRGIDSIRRIKSQMNLSALQGPCKIYLFDECFPKGTLVSLADGTKRPIEDVQQGDCVSNVAGHGLVERCFRNRIDLGRIVRVMCDDGSSIITSDSHLFLTTDGWMQASGLVDSCVLCPSSNIMGQQGASNDNKTPISLCLLRQGVVSNDQSEKTDSDHLLFEDVCQATSRSVGGVGAYGISPLSGVQQIDAIPKIQPKELLQSIVCCKEQNETARNTGSNVQRAYSSKDSRRAAAVHADEGRKEAGQAIFHSHVTKESYAQSAYDTLDDGNEGEEWHIASMERNSWGQRPFDSTSDQTVGLPESLDEGLVYGIGCEDKQSSGLPTRIQDRYWARRDEGGNRSGWQSSCIETDFVARCKKDAATRKPRVVRVESYKQGSNDVLFEDVITDQERSQGYVEFYDLQVSNHPSYLADGFLVHNCHQLTSEAQDGLLKILEDTPRHVYFFLCTTDPQKLKNTIITRCTEIRVKLLSATDLDELLKTVAKKEGKELDQDVIDALVEASDGSARKALVMLHSVIGLADTEAQLGAIENTRVKSAAFDLARALLTAKSFGDVAPLLRTIEEDAEAVRRCILGYCRKVLIGNKRDAARAFQIIDAFRSNVFDSGHAGLAANCYEIFLD